MKFKLLAASALILFSQQTLAKDGWLLLNATQSQGKYDLYLNTKTLQREGAVINVTLRYAYREATVFPFLNFKYDSKEQLNYFECAARKMVMAKTDFLLDKKVVHSINMTAPNPLMGGRSAFDPQPVPAGTPEEEAFNLACKYGQDKK
ncbi:MAG: hypothetical protein KGZ83_02040 [Sulfuricella sp.]|nr:hypothetical protein [Sulfuricella sp.]